MLSVTHDDVSEPHIRGELRSGYFFIHQRQKSHCSKYVEAIRNLLIDTSGLPSAGAYGVDELGDTTNRKNQVT